MEYATLGRSGCAVSTLCLGTMTFGAESDEKVAHAQLDRFVNGESISDQDVVIWYAAHFTHDVHEDIGHVVGPVLRPSDW